MKRIAIAAVLLAVVLGGGIYLYPRLFGQGRDDLPAPGHAGPAPPVQAAAPAAPGAPTAPAGPDAAVRAPEHFALAELGGQVEVRTGSVWSPAQPGQVLSEDDGIRTGPGAHVVVRSADGDQLTLRADVELSLRVTRTVAEVALARGRVGAGSAGSGLHFEITSGRARAVGSGAPGERFTVFAGEHGLVAVATEQGEVRVVAEGREVAVGPGRQTLVRPGATPSDPVAIPPAILLSVSWPDPHPKLRRTEVAGSVEPGSSVRVNGTPAEVDDTGRFSAPVELPDGVSRVEVEAEDPSGRTKVLTSGPIRLKASGPGIAVDPKGLWKQPPQPVPRHR